MSSADEKLSAALINLQEAEAQVVAACEQLDREKSERRRLEETLAAHRELRFDPRDGCPTCGGILESGGLLGGSGLLGWNPTVRKGSRIGLWGHVNGAIEWLSRPSRLMGVFQPALRKAPVAPGLIGTRCVGCRRISVKY